MNLKILISLVTLVGIQTYAYAGNSHSNDSERKETKKVTRTNTAKTSEIDFENYANSSAMINAPHEIQTKIFWFLGPEEILTYRTVCKLWSYLIEQEKTKKLAIIDATKGKPSLTYDEMHSRMLQKSSFLVCHTQLAEIYFDEIIGVGIKGIVQQASKDNKNSSSIQLSDNNQFKQKIHDFVMLISRSSYCHMLLSFTYKNYEPCKDFKSVFLASLVVNKVDAIKNYLWGFVKESKIDIFEFPTLVANTKNHRNLQEYLMCVKILTLSGDDTADTIIDKFNLAIDQEELFQEFYYANTEDNLTQREEMFLESLGDDLVFRDEKQLSPLLCAPFWGAYSTSDKLAFDHYHLFISLLQNSDKKILRLMKKVNIEDLRQFWRYLAGTSPNLAKNYDLPVNFLESNILAQQGNISGSCDILKKTYEEENKEDIFSLVSIIEEFMDIGYYAEALDRLDEINKKIMEQPENKRNLYQCIILLRIAECVLCIGDESKIQDAEKCIKFVTEKMGEDGRLVIQQQENDYEYGEDYIYKFDVDSLRVAIEIYKNNFDHAYKMLSEEIEYDFDDDLLANIPDSDRNLMAYISCDNWSHFHSCIPLLAALKNKPNAPKNIKKLLSQYFSKAFEGDYFETIHGQSMFRQYHGVIKWLLSDYFKNSPIRKSKYSKLKERLGIVSKNKIAKKGSKGPSKKS